MVKVTYTLDDETVVRIRKAAERLRKPQSQIVREAVRHYTAQGDRLTDDERREKLRLLDEMLARVPPRPPPEAAKERRDIRRTRRLRGRLHPSD